MLIAPQLSLKLAFDCLLSHQSVRVRKSVGLGRVVRGFNTRDTDTCEAYNTRDNDTCEAYNTRPRGRGGKASDYWSDSGRQPPLSPS